MKKYRRSIRKQRQKKPEITPLGSICLCFLGSILMGAILGATATIETKNGVLSLLMTDEMAMTPAFSNVLWKYGKYSLIFWVSHCFYYGVCASIPLFLFRGMCLGYTSAILIECMGVLGISSIFSLYFFQNIFLITSYMIPVYCTVIKLLKTFPKGRRFSPTNQNWKVSFLPISSLCLLSILLLFIGVMIEYSAVM